MKPIIQPVWQDQNGKIVACTEKIKVMQENLEELLEIAQEAFEDALLMGCTEAQLRAFFSQLMQTHLQNPYAESSKSLK
ncbi:MAG: DUF1631 domain-containing protein [Neisseriaceae bacterium]|nr:DUF1631 domain-containing protein [Neisseriaceae bacterium]